MSPAPSSLPLARGLRRNQTDAERLLWGKLRGRRLAGWKFKRQVPIGPFIVDFCCSDAWLIVELDGGHHGYEEVAEQDRLRTSDLEQRGYLVLRFWNHEVMGNLDGVCETIFDYLRGSP
jgi:very-short-patch-repair endonuclease